MPSGSSELLLTRVVQARGRATLDACLPSATARRPGRATPRSPGRRRTRSACAAIRARRDGRHLRHVRGPGGMRRASLVAGAGILLVGIGALATVRPWGLRLPRWLVIVPALTGSAYAAAHALTAYVTKPLDAVGVVELQFRGWAAARPDRAVPVGPPVLRAVVPRARPARQPRRAAPLPAHGRLGPRWAAPHAHDRRRDGRDHGVRVRARGYPESVSTARFSRRCSIESVPGIGRMTGERCSSQASLSAFEPAPSSG